ncbi:MAG: hypothetical protein GX575_24540 [Candidatus Anammoximicrobium sp.]|nr:hypothetical protein [Candidatus Anammoximicrobium sp.]
MDTDEPNAMSRHQDHRPNQFPTTRWSLVARAGDEELEARRQALGELVVAYLPALRAHLVYRKGLVPEQDDVLQEFVAQKVLEKNLFAQADRALGKFRTFLLTALDRFLYNWLRHQQLGRRVGGRQRVTIAEVEQECLGVGGGLGGGQSDGATGTNPRAVDHGGRLGGRMKVGMGVAVRDWTGRVWSQQQAQEKYRASEPGRACRREQSRRYRERCRQRTGVAEKAVGGCPARAREGHQHPPGGPKNLLPSAGLLQPLRADPSFSSSGLL